MGSRIKSLLKSLRKVLEGKIISQAEFNNSLGFLQPRGFTIYRTYYGPGSDQQWDELIQAITIGAKDAIREKTKFTDDPAMIAKAEELFKPDIRSNPAVLEGLALEEVRQLYHKETGGQPMNTDSDLWRIFIRADMEVLKNPDLDITKCVVADYDAAVCVLKNL
ncbi:hypothetical protein J3E72DRAFT_198360 [Bipolaris maydis]|nr:hypothetical protein J3E72DRAFT_198360 [Bipolaris maydis]KAJ6278695.1 hypothetical protein J3E71DRAFT_243693 [Bipolaris maydis]